MKILFITSCYADVFKSMLINHDCTYKGWTSDRFTFEIFDNHDIIILEYVPDNILKKKNAYLYEQQLYSDKIIEYLNKTNKKIIVYQMIRCYAIPFYKELSVNLIIEKLKTIYTDNEILELYKNNDIDFEYENNMKYTISNLEKIENLYNDCCINVSTFIKNNYKTIPLFIDRIYGDYHMMKYIWYRICDKLKNYIDIDTSFITEEVFMTIPSALAHINNKCFSIDFVTQLGINMNTYYTIDHYVNINKIDNKIDKLVVFTNNDKYYIYYNNAYEVLFEYYDVYIDIMLKSISDKIINKKINIQLKITNKNSISDILVEEIKYVDDTLILIYKFNNVCKKINITHSPNLIVDEFKFIPVLYPTFGIRIDIFDLNTINNIDNEISKLIIKSFTDLFIYNKQKLYFKLCEYLKFYK